MGWPNTIGLLLAMAGCGAARHEPTFPAPTAPPSALASVECRVAQQVFEGAMATQATGNVVVSPHAVVRALLVLGKRGDDQQRRKVLDYLAFRSDWQLLSEQLAGAFAEYAWAADGSDHDALRAARFRYESIVQPLADEPKESEPWERDGIQSEFNRRELKRASAELPKLGLISLFDAQIAGVPMLSAPLFRAATMPFAGQLVAGASMSRGASYGASPAFRSAFWPADSDGPDTVPARVERGVIVTFSLPQADGPLPLEQLPVLPCGGGGLPNESAAVALDFLAPTFCARSAFELSSVAPSLHSILGDDVALRARLAFDERGTLNLPPRPVRSPGFLNEIDTGYVRRELHFDRPFFVTVHDRLSGAILYIAYVREPSHVSACE